MPSTPLTASHATPLTQRASGGEGVTVGVGVWLPVSNSVGELSVRDHVDEAVTFAVLDAVHVDGVGNGVSVEVLVGDGGVQVEVMVRCTTVSVPDSVPVPEQLKVQLVLPCRVKLAVPCPLPEGLVVRVTVARCVGVCVADHEGVPRGMRLELREPV